MTAEARHPVVLIASSCRWLSTVQLAKALSGVGFAIAFLGPAKHPIDTIGLTCGRFVLSRLQPSRSLDAAIRALRPEIVIPADEMILLLLHELHRDAPRLRDVIERSLGAPENYRTIVSRVALADVAREEGIAVPATAQLTTDLDLAQSFPRLGLPAYLKVDASWGGAGVIRADTADSCRRAYDRLRSYRGIPRTLWRIFAHGDTTRLTLRRAPLEVSIQSEVAGAPANCAVAAWRGEMTACIEAIALQTLGPTGASTIVQIVHDRPMYEACRRLVKRLGLSGLIGFDFIIERGTGRAVLIELNARATQTCHLRFGMGADPAEALWAAVTGEPAREVPPSYASDIIELFPEGRRSSDGAMSMANASKAMEV